MTERAENPDLMSRAMAALDLKSGATSEQVAEAFEKALAKKNAGEVSDAQFTEIKLAFKIFSSYFKGDIRKLEEIFEKHPEYLYLKQEFYESKDPKAGPLNRIA